MTPKHRDSPVFLSSRDREKRFDITPWELMEGEKNKASFVCFPLSSEISKSGQILRNFKYF